MPHAEVRSELDELSRQVAGFTVTELTRSAQNSISIHLSNGSALLCESQESGLSVTLQRPRGEERRSSGGARPTRRQQEYLEFIKKYVHRFGVAPAESDIERHFLVSAPSVNQMIRTLERHGFIERDRDLWSGQAVARSIRVLWRG